MRGAGASLFAFLLATPATWADDLVVADDPEARAAFETFLAHARRVAELPGFHFEFAVTYDEPSGDQRRWIGRLDYEMRTASIYMETTNLSPEPNERSGEEWWHSWNGRQGLRKVVNPSTDYQMVIKSRVPPRPLGYAHFPSDHPYFTGLTSLATYLETHRVHAARLPDGRYRFAVANGSPDQEVPPSWRVFIASRVSDGFLRLDEIRYYFRSPPEGRGETVPEDMELPASYEAGYFRLRKVFSRYVTREAILVPVEWTLRVHATGVTASVAVDEESLRLEPEADHDFQVPVEDGETIFDETKRMAYRAGSLRSHFEEAGRITESHLDTLLSEAGARFTRANAGEAGAYAPPGCAADCLYLALATLERPEPLHAILWELDMEPGNPYTSLAAVTGFLSRRSIEPRALDAKPEVLAEALRGVGNVPAIVHASEGAQHFFSVRNYRAEDDTVQVLDPPAALERKDVESVARGSSGTALFIDPVSGRRAEELVRQAKLAFVVKCSGTALAIGLAVVALFFGVRKLLRRSMGSSCARRAS